MLLVATPGQERNSFCEPTDTPPADAVIFTAAAW